MSSTTLSRESENWQRHKNRATVVAINQHLSHFAEALTFTNPVQDKQLQKELNDLDRKKRSRSLEIFMAQRQFFIDKAFDSNSELRFLKVFKKEPTASHVQDTKQDKETINPGGVPDHNTSISQINVRKTSFSQMPDKRTSFSQMAAQRTSISQMHDQRTSFSQMHDQSTSFSQMHDQRTSFSQMHDQRTSFSQMHDQRTSFSQMHDQRTSFSHMLDQETSFSQMPDRKTSFSQVPDQRTAIFQIPDQRTTISQMPDRGDTFSQMPDQGTSFSEMPDKGISLSQMPDQKTSFSQLPDQRTSFSHMSDLGTSTPQVPEHRASVPLMSAHGASAPNHRMSVPDRMSRLSITQRMDMFTRRGLSKRLSTGSLSERFFPKTPAGNTGVTANQSLIAHEERRRSHRKLSMGSVNMRNMGRAGHRDTGSFLEFILRDEGQMYEEEREAENRQQESSVFDKDTGLRRSHSFVNYREFERKPIIKKTLPNHCVSVGGVPLKSKSSVEFSLGVHKDERMNEKEEERRYQNEKERKDACEGKENQSNDGSRDENEEERAVFFDEKDASEVSLSHQQCSPKATKTRRHGVSEMDANVLGISRGTTFSSDTQKKPSKGMKTSEKISCTKQYQRVKISRKPSQNMGGEEKLSNGDGTNKTSSITLKTRSRSKHLLRSQSFHGLKRSEFSSPNQTASSAADQKKRNPHLCSQTRLIKSDSDLGIYPTNDAQTPRNRDLGFESCDRDLYSASFVSVRELEDIEEDPKDMKIPQSDVELRQEMLLLQIAKSLPLHLLLQTDNDSNSLSDVLGYTERNRHLLVTERAKSARDASRDPRFRNLMKSLQTVHT